MALVRVRGGDSSALFPLTVFGFAGLLVTVLLWDPLNAQSPPEGLWTECKKLLKNDIKQLNEQELRSLKSCLERLKKSPEQAGLPAAATPAPIVRDAPLRIYGKQ